jgi:hypothetical protein
MNTVLLGIIKGLVSEQGVGILDDSKRVSGFLSDMAVN